jgi:3-dehydroquinate dehydratase II
MKKKSILVIHGPNLNLLGKREPEIYGSMSLAEINQKIAESASQEKVSVKTVQSNSEGAIIDHIHDAMNWADGIIINPGAYTHYSYAIGDAVKACGLAVIEVHLSNIYAREDFRHHSVIAPYCKGQISGLGWRGYILALEHILSNY